MRTIYLLATVAFWVGAAGCKTTHPAKHQSSFTMTVDSARLNVVERLVEVVIPGDTVWFEHRVECDNTYPVYDSYPAVNTVYTQPKPQPFKAKMKGIRSDGMIEVKDDGRLMAIFNCNQWRDSVKVRDVEISRLKQTIQSDSTVITVPVRYVPPAYRASMWFSGIVIGLLALWLGIKAAKIYFKLNNPFI